MKSFPEFRIIPIFCIVHELLKQIKRLTVKSHFSSSCFLLTMESDSIEGIYDTLRNCALISKCAGGIGLSVHKIRSSGSYIAGVCIISLSPVE